MLAKNYIYSKATYLKISIFIYSSFLMSKVALLGLMKSMDATMLLKLG